MNIRQRCSTSSNESWPRHVPIPHDVWSYKGRHLVENLFGDIKHFKGISTRFCKYSSTFCAGLYLVTWHLRSRGRKGRSSEYW